MLVVGGCLSPLNEMANCPIILISRKNLDLQDLGCSKAKQCHSQLVSGVLLFYILTRILTRKRSEMETAQLVAVTADI